MPIEGVPWGEAGTPQLPTYRPTLGERRAATEQAEAARRLAREVAERSGGARPAAGAVVGRHVWVADEAGAWGPGILVEWHRDRRGAWVGRVLVVVWQEPPGEPVVEERHIPADRLRPADAGV